MKQQTLTSQPVAGSEHQPDFRRRITIAEALRLSNDIVLRAESGRLEAAQEEASRSLRLESDS